MLYELGRATTVTTTATPVWELMTSGRSISVLEIGIFLNAATASTFQLGRPGNTPTTGTAQTATQNTMQVGAATASAGGIILSGWGTAPTVPAAGNIHRMAGLPAAIGNGIVWTWNPGEMMITSTRSTSLIIWTLSVVSVLNTYVKFIE